MQFNFYSGYMEYVGIYIFRFLHTPHTPLIWFVRGQNLDVLCAKNSYPLFAQHISEIKCKPTRVYVHDYPLNSIQYPIYIPINLSRLLPCHTIITSLTIIHQSNHPHALITLYLPQYATFIS